MITKWFSVKSSDLEILESSKEQALQALKSTRLERYGPNEIR